MKRINNQILTILDRMIKMKNINLNQVQKKNKTIPRAIIE